MVEQRGQKAVQLSEGKVTELMLTGAQLFTELEQNLLYLLEQDYDIFTWQIYITLFFYIFIHYKQEYYYEQSIRGKTSELSFNQWTQNTSISHNSAS